MGMLMKDCRMILEFTNGNIKHVRFERNMCVDSFAKFE